ncbi:DUF4062 domain-containing protein [Mucilaginibacter sp.]|uniref:DUF4062 domain-containing protein n=1 Tax=Mucilaginibacter sp. TaxID=1882438 RepID=UPI0035BBFAB9
MNQLKIFVSSTCYDLTQIRADLFDFISSLGYQPILSEYPSFPIDPNKDTIENCIENVKSADLFILIIGNRYGSVVEHGKSITNTEYLYAKSVGIPVYTFIYKPLLTLLKVWINNKSVDFTNSVDSNLIFEFAENVRTTDKNWCFDFEKAQDITSTLKIQLSHLFKNSLSIRQKLNFSGSPEYWKKLSPAAINIILNKSDNYELRFFIRTLEDELLKHDDLNLDVEYKIRLGRSKSVLNDENLLDWISEEFAKINQFLETADNLFNKAYKKYYGEPGVPADLKGLYYVANAIARLHKEMLSWSINISSTSVSEDHQYMRDLLADYPIRSAANIWDYPKKVSFDLESGFLRVANGEKGIVITSSLNLEVDDEIQKQLLSEFKLLGNKLGL